MNNPARQYEIWIVDFGESAGSEPGKIRPALVLQSDVLNEENHSSVLVCPISSQTRTTGNILRIPLLPTVLNGLKKQSYILCDLIRAVDISRLSTCIGMLDSGSIKKVKQSLTYVLHLY